MQEKPQHVDAYHAYRDMMPRNVRQLARILGVSEGSVGTWKREFGWKERLMLHDKAVQDGLNETFIDDWVQIKADLLRAAIDQVQLGKDLKIAPQTTRDMMAASKEARSIMGESDHKIDVTAEVTTTVVISPELAKKIGDALVAETDDG